MKARKAKNAYMKKKDPLFVRESLLNAAFERAATKGMADVTINKVSELADVTKGAFFHHFDSKETLVTELMRMLLTARAVWCDRKRRLVRGKAVRPTSRNKQSGPTRPSPQLRPLVSRIWRRTGTDPVFAWPRFCANNGTVHRQQTEASRCGE
jgi:AcrR family transcriptional regulator